MAGDFKIILKSPFYNKTDKKMKLINYSHYIKNTNLLGPYNRCVLWVQGCCFSCEGCIAPEMQKSGGYFADTDTLAAILLKDKSTEGVTLSGGEPFLQADALSELIMKMKSERDTGVIVYSGFTLDELKNKSAENNDIKNLLSMTDILIDGRYIKNLDDGIAYRGSSNQNIICLSDRYKEIAESYYGNFARKTEIRVDKDKLVLVGVPSGETLAAVRNIIDKARSFGNDGGI